MQLTCIALCSASTALCAQPAAADDWQITPSMQLGTSYADNPRLLTEGGLSTSGTTGELKANLQRRTERSELTLRPRLVSARYSDDESLDSDDRYINGGYHWVGERSEWTADLGWTRDTTLTSELGSTGLVQSNRRHEAGTFSVAPKVMFTDRVSGGIQMYLANNRYIDAELTGLTDYRYLALSLFSQVVLTDAGSALNVSAQGGRLTTAGLFGSETEDGSLRLGWSFQPWLLWTVSLSGGPSMVKTSGASDTGLVVDGEIKRQGDRWSMAVYAGRSQAPTGRGVLTRRDEAKVTFNRALTERLSANLVARWSRSEDLVPQQGGSARFQVDYAQLGLGANYRLTRDLSLALQLWGNTQDYELATERANSYRASLSIVWNGQPHSL